MRLDILNYKAVNGYFYPVSEMGFCEMFSRWRLTVAGLIFRTMAISLFVLACETRPRTLFSATVSCLVTAFLSCEADSALDMAVTRAAVSLPLKILPHYHWAKSFSESPMVRLAKKQSYCPENS